MSIFLFCKSVYGATLLYFTSLHYYLRMKCSINKLRPRKFLSGLRLLRMKQPAVKRTLYQTKQYMIFDSGSRKARTFGDFEALSLERRSLRGHGAHQEKKEKKGEKRARQSLQYKRITRFPHNYSSPLPPPRSSRPRPPFTHKQIHVCEQFYMRILNCHCDTYSTLGPRESTSQCSTLSVLPNRVLSVPPPPQTLGRRNYQLLWRRQCLNAAIFRRRQTKYTRTRTYIHLRRFPFTS